MTVWVGWLCLAFGALSACLLGLGGRGALSWRGATHWRFESLLNGLIAGWRSRWARRQPDFFAFGHGVGFSVRAGTRRPARAR